MNSWNITDQCEHVVHIAPFHQCDFVRSVYDCQNNASLINYLDFLYCTTDEINQGITPIIQLTIVLLLLFLLLGTTAGEYLCPSLVNISRTLNMSQSVAGVTLLAFGNGAPDVISTIAGVGQNRSSLVAGELFGGALYICTMVIGLLILLNKFTIPKSLLRDVLFYLGASLWAFALFRRGYVEMRDALGFLILYVLYLTVAIGLPSVISNIRSLEIFKKAMSQTKFSSSDDGYLSEERGDQFIYEPIQLISPILRGKTIVQRKCSSSLSLHRHFENAICSLITNADHEIRERGALSRSARSSICESSLRLTRCPSRLGKAFFYVSSLSQQESTPLLRSTSLATRPTEFIFPKVYTEWQELILRLWPAEAADWNMMSWPAKLYHIVMFPMLLPLVLTIPVVDEHHRRASWSRPLNVLQCIAAPLVVLALTKNLELVINGIPIWSIALIAGSLLGMIVLGSSVNQRPPRYFSAFSFLGFGLALVWIYRLATEVVSILKAFGIFFAISEEVLGASVLTWGNYLGDLVTNLSVASQGYPEMAVNACLSTSLVALLIGFGSAFMTRFIANGDFDLGSRIPVQGSYMLDVIYFSLLASMALLTVGMCVTQFRSKRSTGVILVVAYLVFVVAIFSKEFGLFALLSSQF